MMYNIVKYYYIILKGRIIMSFSKSSVFKKCSAFLFVLIFAATAELPAMSASAADNKSGINGYSYFRQAYYGKPYIFDIAWNISDKTAKSYGSKKVALSDKAAMNVWYADGLKKDMSDKNVTAALAEVLNRIKADYASFSKPIVLNIENTGNATKYYKDENIMYYAAVLPFADVKTRQAYLKKAYNDDSEDFFSVSLEIVNNSGTSKKYLDKAYKDDNIAIFSKCLDKLDDALNDKDFGAVVNTYAGKAYADGEIAFFAVLADRMDGDTAEAWFNRTKKDKNIAFESIFDNYWDELDDKWDEFDDALDKFDDAWDDFDDKWDDYENYVNSSDYAKYGVTYKNGHYYYKGEPVRYFLDIQRSGSSSTVATVETNPNGKADIKIVRDKNGNITGVKKLTDKEIKKYFGDR